MEIKIKGQAKIKISNSKGVYNIISKILKKADPVDKDKEHFFVIGLSRSNHIKYIELVSLGTLTGTLVEPREVFRKAIMEAAASIVLSHNHPSGSTLPSPADLAVTKKLKEAGNIIQINVLDHVIIAGRKHYSFAEEGNL